MPLTYRRSGVGAAPFERKQHRPPHEQARSALLDTEASFGFPLLQPVKLLSVLILDTGALGSLWVGPSVFSANRHRPFRKSCDSANPRISAA